MADMPLGAYDTIGNVWEMVDHRGVAENFGVGWDSGTLPRGPLTHSPIPVPPDRRVGFRCQRDTIPLFSRCSAVLESPRQLSDIAPARPGGPDLAWPYSS